MDSSLCGSALCESKFTVRCSTNTPSSSGHKMCADREGKGVCAGHY